MTIRLVPWNPSSLRLASFRCVHRKADEGGIPGRMSTEENAARCVPGRREAQRDSGSTALGPAEFLHHPEDTGEHRAERLGVEPVTWGQRDHALGGN